MLKTISPIDGSVYVKREYANTNEIENTLSNATEIVNEWKNTDLQIRKKLITKFVEVFLENNKEIEEELCRQMGRPLSQCSGEMRGFEERAKYMIENADRALEIVESKKEINFEDEKLQESFKSLFAFNIKNTNYLY